MPSLEKNADLCDKNTDQLTFTFKMLEFENNYDKVTVSTVCCGI